MKYALINKKKGEQAGFNAKLHKVKDEKMVVNENELRLVNGDIFVAAKFLGGEIKEYNEIKNFIL